MPACYLDTSAVLKRYVNEARSADFESFVLAHAFDFVMSPLVVTEIAGALQRRVRVGDITSRYAEAARQRFHDDLIGGGWQLLDFDPATFSRAATLVATLASPLSTLDALHLTSAAHAEVAALATADRQLAAAARKMRLRVFPFFREANRHA
jgi:predicted nucleic acid-binding protein